MLTTAAPYSIPYYTPGDPADMAYITEAMATRLAELLGNMPYGKMWKTAGAQSFTTPNVAQLVTMTGNRVAGGVTFADAADTLTVPTAGLYRIECGLYTAGTASTSYQAAIILKNGSVLDRVQTPTSTADGTIRNIVEINLAANDVLSLQGVAGQNTSFNGSGEGSTCWLSVRWMRGTL